MGMVRGFSLPNRLASLLPSEQPLPNEKPQPPRKLKALLGVFAVVPRE